MHHTRMRQTICVQLAFTRAQYSGCTSHISLLDSLPLVHEAEISLPTDPNDRARTLHLLSPSNSGVQVKSAETQHEELEKSKRILMLRIDELTRKLATAQVDGQGRSLLVHEIAGLLNV